MPVNYNNEYAGLRSVVARGDYRIPRTDVGPLVGSVTDSSMMTALGAAAAQGRALEASANIQAASELARTGVPAFGNLAAATVGAAGTVGASGVRAKADLEAARTAATAAVDAAHADRVARFGTGLLGLGGTVALARYMMKDAEKERAARGPFPTFTPSPMEPLPTYTPHPRAQA